MFNVSSIFLSNYKNLRIYYKLSSAKRINYTVYNYNVLTITAVIFWDKITKISNIANAFYAFLMRKKKNGGCFSVKRAGGSIISLYGYST